MATCYRCGGFKSDYGTCITCDNRAIQEKQNRAQERQSKELKDAIEDNARTQMQIALLQAERDEARHQEFLDKEDERIDELRQQTQFLKEQSIPDEEAFNQGFNFETTVYLNPQDSNSELLHEHYFDIYFNEDGRIITENFDLDFITPRLKKKYIAGITERIAKDFSNGINPKDIERQAFVIGRKLLNNRRDVKKATEGFSENFAIKYTLGIGNNRFLDLKINRDYSVGLKCGTDIATGKVFLENANLKCFDRDVLNDALFAGVMEALNVINDAESCELRVDTYQRSIQKQEAARQENQKIEIEFEVKHNEWKKNQRKSNFFDIALKAVLAIPIIFVWNINFLYAMLYALIYLPLAFSIKLFNTKEPNKQPYEPIEKTPNLFYIKSFESKVKESNTIPFLENDLVSKQPLFNYSQTEPPLTHLIDDFQEGKFDFSNTEKNSAELTKPPSLYVGHDAADKPIFINLQQVSNLYVSGSNSKSIKKLLESLIASCTLSFSPTQLRLIVKAGYYSPLSRYSETAYMLCPTFDSIDELNNALNWTINEIHRRKKLMEKFDVNNIYEFNEKLVKSKKDGQFLTNPFSLTPDDPEPLFPIPAVIFLIEDADDLILSSYRIFELIQSINSENENSGVHLIGSSNSHDSQFLTKKLQSYFSNFINLDSKSNFLELRANHGIALNGKSTVIEDEQSIAILNWINSNFGFNQSSYIDGITGELHETLGEIDPLYQEAVDIVLNNNSASISLVQRHLRIGYNRAANLLEQMQFNGVVSAMSLDGKEKSSLDSR